MSAGAWLQFGAAILTALLGSGIFTVLLHYRAQNSKTKAEAAKLNAETRAIAVDDQSQIITDLGQEIARLTARVDALEQRNERHESRNGELRRALLAMSHWAGRVWSGLTEQQRTQAGPPPDTDSILHNG